MSDTSRWELTEITLAFKKVEQILIKFNADVKGATKPLRRIGFQLWLMDKPWYVKPFARFAFWIEEKFVHHSS